MAEQTVGGKPTLPPVEKWNPPLCGDIDMEIRADGTWFYLGTPIGRAPLVRLFSTVLRKDEDGQTYLVTPVEKLAIRVADAPFLAVEMQTSGQDGQAILSFRTNVGDVVEAGGEGRSGEGRSGEGKSVVRMRPVSIYRQTATDLELRDGLKGGERVVVGPPASLRDGDAVTPPQEGKAGS